jgi:adenine phosphoribosyltransferase
MDLETETRPLKSAIRDVPDFPKPGIVFKDITPLLQDARLFHRSVDLLVALAGQQPVDKVVAIESRGFLYGGALADRLGAGLVLVRKAGKLPWRTVEATYALEYGTDTVAMHEDAIGSGERALVVDDVIATGGTARATGELVAQAGAASVAFLFLVELGFLEGRKKLVGHDVRALIRY